MYCMGKWKNTKIGVWGKGLIINHLAPIFTPKSINQKTKNHEKYQKCHIQ